MCACGSCALEINLILDQQKAVGGRKPKSAVKSFVKVKGENNLSGHTAAGVVYSCSHAHATSVETFQISISAFVLRFLNLNVYDNLFSISIFGFWRGIRGSFPLVLSLSIWGIQNADFFHEFSPRESCYIRATKLFASRGIFTFFATILITRTVSVSVLCGRQNSRDIVFEDEHAKFVCSWVACECERSKSI